MTHNIYKAANGRVLRLINDDVLVRMDKPKEESAGGIIIPTTVADRGDSGIMTTGTVLAFGFIKVGGRKGIPAQRLPIPDLEVGQRTVFVRFYAEQHSNKQIQERVETDVIRMKAADLLFVYSADDEERVLC